MSTPDPVHPGLLDVDLLRTFAAIVDHGSFSRAAQAVFRTPSAVSMQMKRLEEAVDRPLFQREGRNVALTPDGEALLGYARRMLRLNDEALSHFRAPPLEGVVRFGAPDDFGTRFLPDMLLRFSRTHSRVQVDVALGTSARLQRQLADGDLDLTLVTEDETNRTAHGQVVFREPLLWAGLRGGTAWRRRPLPLALANHGCAWRRLALEALDAAGVDYRIAYTSEHCAGQKAAMLADLAVAPFPASLVLAPMEALDEEADLPPLGHYHLELLRAPGAGAAAEALAGHVVSSFSQLAAVPRAAIDPRRPPAENH